MVRRIVQDVFHAFCPFLNLESLNLLLSVVAGTNNDLESDEGDEDSDDLDHHGRNHGHHHDESESEDDSDDESESDGDTKPKAVKVANGKKVENMAVESDEDGDGESGSSEGGDGEGGDSEDPEEVSFDDEQMFAMDESISNMFREAQKDRKEKTGMNY
jgi:hypothetical protein